MKQFSKVARFRKIIMSGILNVQLRRKLLEQ